MTGSGPQQAALVRYTIHTGLPLRQAATDVANRFSIAPHPGNKDKEPVTTACRYRSEPVN